MTKAQILDLLEDLENLLRLNDANPFKIRAFEKARDAIAGAPDFEALLARGELTEIPGIGKGIASVIGEFVASGACQERDALRAALPAGLEELTKLSGLGPKKARSVIDALGVHSVAELEYACRENRLVELPGFGAKTQDKILRSIQTWKNAQGKALLGDVLQWGEAFTESLAQGLEGKRVSESGLWRRRQEVLADLEYVVEQGSLSPAQALLARFQESHGAAPIPVSFAEAPRAEFGSALFAQSSSAEHKSQIFLKSPPAQTFETEENLYQLQGLPWIDPVLRESGGEVLLARAGEISQVIEIGAVRGVFHNHTTRSDGTHSAREMVGAARELGLSYIGISDHSRSAFYARGLAAEAIVEQEAELTELQRDFPDVRIFRGVESDILADGALDYEDAVLEKMDFVVASIHSRFQMDESAMTERMLRAIRNPHTRMIGHLTGRILLGRAGYALDMERILSEAAEQGVAIELNAHPSRLDIDWRWGELLRKTGCPVMINPDAHEMAGLAHVRIGELMARKALLPAAQVINTRDTAGVEKWLRTRK